MQHYENQIF